jgi:diguanylate cyclase (GGDEF)-like protein
VPAARLHDEAIRCGRNCARQRHSVESIVRFLANERAFVTDARLVDEALSAVLTGYFDELVVEALRDPVTGLPNRAAFEKALNVEIARAKRYSRELSLIIADVDDFKLINDRLGHPSGDRVLAQISEILQKTLRRTDHVFRFGGDEFAALCPETSSTYLMGALRRVEENLRGITECDARLSWGLATCPGDADDASTLIEIADQRLYEQKRRRKD